MSQYPTLYITALLIHVAKIDDNYSQKEQELIKKFIGVSLNNQEVQKLFNDAEDLEKNSNDILVYTKQLKKLSLNEKAKIIKDLWIIIISDNSVSIYEDTIIKKICSLIYFPVYLSNKIKKEISKL